MSDHSSRVGLLSADEKPRSFYKQTKTLWKRAGRQM
jgi:hypothetical protein